MDIAAIGGGITDTKWVLRLAVGDPLVLRWSDPRSGARPAASTSGGRLSPAGCSPAPALPVPRLIASDPDGATAGGPANLMTWRPGRVRLDRLEPAAITALAQLAVAVHRQPVPAEDQPPTFSFRGPTEPKVPGWARWPGLWRQAIGLWAGRPAADAVRPAAP